ncbi:hypothetical protein LUZ60_009641 [Juncus effusus]|nr:hypothetical protein LUZ60_009641 [Juncus effusus]
MCLQCSHQLALKTWNHHSKMLQILFLLLPLIPQSFASSSCNRICGKTTVQYPFGFSSNCGIPLSCDSGSSISFSTFPLHNFTTNYTFLLSVPVNCTRSISSLSTLFGHNYAMTSRNGLFLHNCTPSVTTPCLLPTLLISQMSHFYESCGKQGDNITCLSNGTGGLFLSEKIVLQSGCTELFTSVLYEFGSDEQTALDLGVVEVGWWMTGDCGCSANASCSRVGRDGFQCKCNEGYVGDGFANGKGCVEETYRGSHSNSVLIIAAISIAGTFLLLSATAIFFWRRRWPRRCFRNDKEDSSVSLQDEADTNLKCIVNPNAEYEVFDLNTMRNATNNFSDRNKLGKGGFGPVYMGTLLDWQEIAVKRLSGSSKQGLRELKNEVDFHAKLKHKNLVKLLGCCIQKHEKLLCYEYLPNGSLDKILFAKDHMNHVQLDWKMRYKIIEGISRGLYYLHEESHLKIIHRDLKASNILLDTNMSPKISDFGLARFFDEDQTHKDTSIIAGTFGYMAPEYVLHGIFSAKSDVYSYGVLLLEIIAGQKNSSFAGSGRASNLISYAFQHWANGTMDQMKDPMLEDENLEDIKRCTHIALLCVQEEPADRPNMETVNLLLGGYSNTIPTLPSTWEVSGMGYCMSEEEILQDRDHDASSL